MSDLDLIRQLEDLLGHPLEEIPEAQFEQHNQAAFTRDWDSPDWIEKDSYSMTDDGAVSGLLIQPVTSDLLTLFPFWQFSQIRHLHLRQVNLESFSFISDLKDLNSLNLGDNKISDISFLIETKKT